MLFRSLIKYDEPEQGSNLAREILANFKHHDGRVLLVDAQSGREWTGAELLDQASRVATGLIKKVGLKPDDIVLLLCEHTDYPIILLIAIILAGGSLLFSDPEDCFEEQRVLCDIVKPNIIVTHPELKAITTELRDKIKGLEGAPIVWINSSSLKPKPEDNTGEDKESDEVVTFEDLIKTKIDEELIEQTSKTKISPKQFLSFMLTSGSTGRAKIVPTTHEQFLHKYFMFVSSSKNHFGSAKDQPSELSSMDDYLLPVTAKSVLAGNLSLSHDMGFIVMFFSIHIGARYVIMPEYDPERFWQAVHDYRITACMNCTTFTYKLMEFLRSFINAGDTEKWDLSCFEFIISGGSKLVFFKLIQEINKFYSQMQISHCYGATEIGFISGLMTRDRHSHIDSVGHLAPGVVAKIVDRATGTLLGPNEQGELCVMTKSKFTAYKCSPGDDPVQLTAQCNDEQGFYKTGDIAHFDEGQRLYLHGRIKDTLYLMFDWKIMPTELEEIINKHPLVESSIVVGLPDPDLPGCHAPRAFVKLISESSEKFAEIECPELRNKYLDQDQEFICVDIYKFVANLTAEPKHLKGGVRILDEFPTVGLLQKVDRNSLKLMN